MPGGMPMGEMPGMPVGGMPMEGGYGGDASGYCGPGYGGPGYGGPGYGKFGADGCDGWTNRYFVFGEALFIRPRNAEVSYAVPINGATIVGPTSPQVQLGAVRVADPDYAPGWRVGMGAVLSPRSAFAVTYTQFDRDTFDSLSLPGTGAVVRSLVTHPNVLTAAGNGLDTAAVLQTQFQLFDADYKGLMNYGPQGELAYVVGVRYANLEQHFAAGFAPATGFEEVLAESEFDGGGLKFGLEGVRRGLTHQFFGYGKTAASFIAGEFRSRYQFNTPALAADTDTSWKVGRVMTILDLEAGVGWQNFTGNLRFSTGYMFSAWYNTVKVNDWINAVQNNNFVDPSVSGVVTFDGFTAKMEFLW
jgi:hypothetical protein